MSFQTKAMTTKQELTKLVTDKSKLRRDFEADVNHVNGQLPDIQKKFEASLDENVKSINLDLANQGLTHTIQRENGVLRYLNCEFYYEFGHNKLLIRPKQWDAWTDPIMLFARQYDVSPVPQANGTSQLRDIVWMKDRYSGSGKEGFPSDELALHVLRMLIESAEYLPHGY